MEELLNTVISTTPEHGRNFITITDDVKVKDVLSVHNTLINMGYSVLTTCFDKVDKNSHFEFTDVTENNKLSLFLFNMHVFRNKCDSPWSIKNK